MSELLSPLLSPSSSSSILLIDDGSPEFDASRMTSSCSLRWPSGWCNDRRRRNLCLVALLVIVPTVVYLLYYFETLSSLTSSSTPLTLSADLHFAVVIDAGSSGSRAYLYQWPTHSGDPHQLLKITPMIAENGKPLYKKVAPGLSSLENRPEDALSYITPLLEFAESHIPKAQIKETPLYILATAGMRLLSKNKQERIVNSLREAIHANFNFLFPEGNLEVITGKQEGIYQWLAINYVLGKFNHNSGSRGSQDELVALNHDSSTSSEGNSKGDGDNLVFRPRTVGAIDMGGASMQIAMEITSGLQLEGMAESDRAQVTEINLGCVDHDTEHTYRIFVTTFLGYGANEALARHRRDLILDQIESHADTLIGLSSSSRLLDPCLPMGYEEDVNVEFNLDKYEFPDKYKIQLIPNSAHMEGNFTQLYLKGTGDWKLCYQNLKDFTLQKEKYSLCSDVTTSCPTEGINVPAIQFENSEFYAFSEFWYTMEDVLRMGGPYIYNKFSKAASDFCNIQWSTTWDKFSKGDYPKADKERMKTQCFKSAWVTVALHEGFGFPNEYSTLSAAPETVKGQVVHWTIGALLYRTRFLPLRSIESHSEDGVSYHRGSYHSAWASTYLYSNYIVLVCLVLVFSAIIIYMYGLKRYVKPSTLRRVPTTLSFWIPSSDLQKSPYNYHPLTRVTSAKEFRHY